MILGARAGGVFGGDSPQAIVPPPPIGRPHGFAPAAGRRPGAQAQLRDLTPLARIGWAVVDAARADLNVRETSFNRGARVDEMLANVGLDNPRKPGDGYPWCGAATSTWIQEAARASGVTAPIAGSGLAQEIMRQLQRVGRWRDAAGLGDARLSLRPGMVLVWTRGERTSGLGHVGIVEQVEDADLVGTIEGNSGPLGDGVYRMARRLSNPALLGAGWLDDGVAVDRPAPPGPPPGSDEEPLWASAAALGGGVLGGFLFTHLALRRRRRDAAA